MYESYWQLTSKPFENDMDTRLYFGSDPHEASLLKLRYLIENRKGAGLLVGGTGLGKSYLLQVLREQLGDVQGPFVSLVFPQMSAAELLNSIAVELGSQEDETTSGIVGLDKVIRTIQQSLIAYNREGRHPVLVVDEAHLIEDLQVFQALRLLLNFHESGARFSLILSGQRELISRIHRIPQLEARLGVKCVLQGLSYEETMKYVSWRLQAAGAKRSLFEPEALDAVYELSGGIPR
ncbi:MAG: AAA family ATPase, partial [Planctomycetales bacterium]